MVKCYKDLSTCDADKVEHVVNAIYQAFDVDNDGKVGKNILDDDLAFLLAFEYSHRRLQRICHWILIDNKGVNRRETRLYLSTLW